MSAPPDVSVIIPVYNGGALFSAQLEALCRQQFDGAWELVIADNGSSDGSPGMAESYAGRLPIRVVDASERRGPAHARNVGAEHARSGLLAYCDADDVVDHAWLSALCAASAAADLVGGAYDATVVNPPEITQARGLQKRDQRLPDGPCRFLSYAGSANFLIRRRVLEEIGGWDETLPYCEDVELCWRAQLAGYQLAFAPDAVVHYRLRSSATELFRQVASYTMCEAELYRRFRGRGAQRRTAADVARSAWWLASRSPYPVLGTRRRHTWVSVAASAVGRVRGSVHYRVFYP
jgi:GT2 family glycosyltransferase